MQSVIDDLFDGEIRPCEYLLAHDPEYWEKTRKVDSEKKYFAGLLGDEDKRRFEQLNDMQMVLDNYCEKAFFVYGLKLGIRLMSEALSENGDTSR